MIHSQIHDKAQKPVYDSSRRFVLDLWLDIEIATILIFVISFCNFSASKKYQF